MVRVINTDRSYWYHEVGVSHANQDDINAAALAARKAESAFDSSPYLL